MSINFSDPAGNSLTTVFANYTTLAAVGSTKAVTAVTATTLSTNSTNVASWGFATSVAANAHNTAHDNIVADLAQIKRTLNAIISDLKGG